VAARGLWGRSKTIVKVKVTQGVGRGKIQSAEIRVKKGPTSVGKGLK